MINHLDCVAGGVGRRDPRAFDQLYNAMADRLYAYAYRFLSDRHGAEDAVQQAFLELAGTTLPPTTGRSLEVWLFASVRYTCIDLFRRRSRRPEVPSERLPDVGDEDDYQLGLDPNLEEALAALTPEQRQIVHLKYVEGFDGQQIADITDSNRVAVYVLSSRAHRRLKNLLVHIDSRSITKSEAVQRGPETDSSTAPKPDPVHGCPPVRPTDRPTP